MLDQLPLLTDMTSELWLLVLAAAVVVHLAAIVRAILRRRGQLPAQKSSQARPLRIAEPVRISEHAQIERLLDIVAQAAPKAERMREAHDTAARHLDSAEYLLQRLFEEFPMLAATRAGQRTSAVGAHRQPTARISALAA